MTDSATMPDLSNLCPLLFETRETASHCWLGPVEISPAVVHGRGLIVTRDVQPGECLFVITPTVSADIQKVLRRWNEQDSKEEGSLEQVAENVLLEEMKQCLHKEASRAVSFLLLLGDEGERVCTDENFDRAGAIQVLLGSGGGNDWPRTSHPPSDDRLRSIIRRNAFGPDFHNYSVMQEALKKHSTSTVLHPYSRILGLYPLAAMLNHACTSNAVRVFCGEIMAVHASAAIPKDKEVLWSYIPPIQPYEVRQHLLQSKFGFACQCERCQKESELYDETLLVDLKPRLKPLECFIQAKLDKAVTKNELEGRVAEMEEILKELLLSNEARRYLRVSYMHLYIHYFNTALSLQPTNAIRQEILRLATQMHFSLVSTHNASTEHLSILHLCYELVSVLHPTDKTKIRFWTEQLKMAHMIRYGSLGNDLESVRNVMKHTRVVLRNQNGLHKAGYGFI